MTSNTSLFDGMVIFVEVIKANSFTAAADVTGHSTSYISKEINKLEARLGTRLMNRTTRSIGLTPEGKIFYQQCVQIINDAENALNLINQQESKPKGTLKISCPVSLGLNYFPSVFGNFLTQYPDVELDIDVSDRQVDVIAEGFDVVIRAQTQLDDSTLISRKIFETQGYTIASPKYLEKYGRPGTPRDLLDHRCLCYSPMKQPTLWSYSRLDGELESVEVKPSILCNSAEMELAMVLEGYGITRMPGFNVQRELKEGKLVSLFHDYEHLKIDVYLVYPSRKHISPKVRAFIDFVVKEIKKLH